MDVTPLVKQGAQIIQSYSEDTIRVNGVAHKPPLLVYADRTEPWNIQTGFAEMTEKDFAPLIESADEIDVILLGCGAETKFLPAFLKKTLRTKNLHIETMDTGAAARTYNVLLAEGRRVVAGFLKG